MINLFKFIIGTVFGSFITLTCIRIIRHESFILPPSHCDNCNHQLKPWELIPIVSYLILRGKCRWCHQSIGLITFIGEFFGGLIILINPLSTLGILEMIFEFILLFTAECDYYTYSIPIWSSSILFIIIILSKLITHHFNLMSLIITIIFYIITLIINSNLHKIGNGDVDLIFLLYFKTDIRTILFIILISSTLAIIKYLIHHNNVYIPYAPYLTFTYFLLQL